LKVLGLAPRGRAGDECRSEALDDRAGASGHLPIVRQSGLASISRSAFYSAPTGEMPLNLASIRRIDEQFQTTPIYPTKSGAPTSRCGAASSISGHGLGDPQAAGLAFAEHDGCRVLHPGTGGWPGSARRTRRAARGSKIFKAVSYQPALH
jgi:hypothetical protein